MDSRIRVLHIIKSLGRGGAEMLLPETLKLHNSAEFEWHYGYFLPWKNQMVDSLINNGGRVVCFTARNNIQLLLKVKAVVQYVKNHNIQLIHAHLPWAGILARIVGKLTNVPVIYTEHNKQERYHVLTRWMNIASMNWQCQVIAVSKDVELSIRRYKPKLKPPLITVLNGVNVAHFIFDSLLGQNVRQSLGIPTEAPVIGTIAVFRFQKRLDLWLELAGKISEQRPDVHFIIVGDGPLKQHLLNKRDSLGLQTKVHFPGLMTEVRPFLATFDLFMMTSIFEGLPIALLEAMAMKRPVITTDVGGIKEVIRHGIDGMLCDVNESERLVDLAITLLDNKAKCIILGEEGRKRIEDKFSMKQMVDHLELVYKSIIP